MSSACSVPAQQQLQTAIQWLEAALAQLHDTSESSCEQRRAAEAALIQFRRADSSWSVCLQLLPVCQQSCIRPAATPHLSLFIAQTLRTKINEQGSTLPNAHKEQLRQTLLQQLLDESLPTPLLRQLCLAFVSLAAFLPDWNGWLQHVGKSLPLRNAVQLLHDLAEEGGSDWRHVVVPGLTSSERLSWATTTRDRFRSWSPDALQLLHTWLQHVWQQQQQPTVPRTVVSLLNCLCAWVKLGCLHHVTTELAQATADVGLQCVQSAYPEVVSAAGSLLVEATEYAPEQLLDTLQPQMLQVAAAAVRSVSGTSPDLMHAATWAAAFAAFAAAVPQKLLAEGEDDDASGEQLRQALLQVALLPQVHDSQLVCLPALQVWSNMLGHESPTTAAAYTAAGGGSGGLSRASTGGADADTMHGTPVGAAAVDEGDAAGDGTDSCTREVPGCVAAACYQLLFRTAYNCMLWQQTEEGREAVYSQEAAAALHDLFLAVCCVLGQWRYLDCFMHTWQQHRPHTVLQQGQCQAQEQQPAWLQQEALQPVLQALQAVPEQLRLQVAVDMAAAAMLDTTYDAPPDAADDGTTMMQAAAGITQLLSCTAVCLQQGSCCLGTASHARLTLSFCKAVQVWSMHLACHFADTPEGTSSMGSLMQLLLRIAADPPEGADTARPSAAAALRALSSAALHLGWGQLYLGAPLLLQAVQDLPEVDASDQDLLATLSMCLAAIGAPQQQLQQLRSAAVQQLVAPAISHLDRLLQQLQSGQTWQALGKPADMQLCQHMVRIRVVLEAAWLRQEHQQQYLRQCSDSGQQYQALDDEAVLCRTALSLSDRHQGDERRSSSGGESGQQQDRAAADRAVLADLQDNPALQLVLTRLWEQLHQLVLHHVAAGKFLQHHAKCCTKLLKIRPELLLRPQTRLLQFLDVAVAGLVRPGGCSLGEPLLLLLEVCCQQRQGSELLLEARASITSACSQLLAAPELLPLQQPGAADTQPDLAEAVLKLSGAFIRHSSTLQPTRPQLAGILPPILAAAAACARSCHKKVGSCALNTLTTILAAAAAAGSQGQLLQEVVASHGPLIAQGALGALLVPSPLPRLNKVSTALQDLAALATAVEQQQQQQQQQVGFGRAVGNAAAQGVLLAWLCQATQGLVPQVLSAGDAAELAGACASLLAAAPQDSGARASSGSGSSSRSCGVRSAPASRSFAAARKLKKRLRDFAERYMRASSTG